jgi:hypothetical protein
MSRVQSALIDDYAVGAMKKTFLANLKAATSQLASSHAAASWVGGVGRVKYTAVDISGTTAGVSAQVPVWQSVLEGPPAKSSFTVTTIRAVVTEYATLVETASGWRLVSERRYVKPDGRPTEVPD